MLEFHSTVLPIMSAYHKRIHHKNIKSYKMLTWYKIPNTLAVVCICIRYLDTFGWASGRSTGL